jgi:hypothetical protein
MQISRPSRSKRDALVLAMRVNLCNALAIDCGEDLQALLGLQRQDGGCAIGWMYGYGSTGVKIGNRGLTTALVLKAIMSSYRRGKVVVTESDSPCVS